MPYDETAAAGPHGTRMDVDPDLLDRQGGHFTTLGDALRQQATANEVRPLRLGGAPPAVKFTQLLARMAGPEGAARILSNWGHSLESLGDNQRLAARDYRGTDDAGAATFRGVDPDGGSDDPGRSG